jgi:hypothetical protein
LEQSEFEFSFGAAAEVVHLEEKELLEQLGAAEVVEGLGLTTTAFLMHQF